MEAIESNLLDVTVIEPRLKHPTIFEYFDKLSSGESFTLHNDHDPRPLYYQLQDLRGDIFSWEYLMEGPEIWRIKITKTQGNEKEGDDVLDATQLEPRIKHQTIFAKFDKLEPGQSFVLRNDHDPKPLYYQLLEFRGDVFDWEYLEEGPEVFRIKISKKQIGSEKPEAVDNIDKLTLDVTALPPQLKHPTIFEKFDELQPGESLGLHNDHDPKPLYYQLLAERGDIFTWEYLEQGPTDWRIRITRKLSGVAEETLGELATKDLRTVEVFKKYGLDFCCGGKKTVKEACAEKGIDATKVEQELQMTEKSNAATAQRPLPYNDWNLDFLADYIVNTHHSYVRKVIPDLKQYAAKVARVHGDRHPELIPIQQLVDETCDEMIEHAGKEEAIVFPFIKKLVSGEDIGDISVDDAIAEMVQDHELVGGNTERVRVLSNNYTVPQDGCASYSFLFKSLEDFENDLHLHIHLENNILFPKAIKLATK